MAEKFTVPYTTEKMCPPAVHEVVLGPTHAPPASARRRSGKSHVLQRMRRKKWVYVVLLPGVIYFLLFYYLPLLGNIVAFQDYSPYLGFFRSAWVGWAN